MNFQKFLESRVYTIGEKAPNAFSDRLLAIEKRRHCTIGADVAR